MKTKSFITAMLVAVMMFGFGATAVFAYDCDCDHLGPQYQNMAEVQPNK